LPSSRSAEGQSPHSRLALGSVEERLAALGQLCSALPGRPLRGTNLHIHTNESFSVFRSPSEAVWQARQEGVAVLGINDHYTVAGHDEFRGACRTAGIRATFSLEAVAMDRAAERGRVLLNDPDNPGRVYLCAKGVTRYPPEDSPAAQSLAALRAANARRCREMTGRVAALCPDRLGAEGPSWEDVLALTPRGNVTERHVAKAMFLRLKALAAERSEPGPVLVTRLCAAEPPSGASDAALQNFIRAKLLKAGAPGFVLQGEDAFLSFEDMRRLFLAFGAIPTYPVMGNPVTDGERSVEALLDRLEAAGIHAVEVIPHRNTRERLSEIVAAARARHWPVFNGTEHNTPEPQPMLDPFALHPEFEPHFADSAAVLLGHQERVRRGESGFVDAEGRPTIADNRERFELFRDAGR
jgi:hypothetical protein